MSATSFTMCVSNCKVVNNTLTSIANTDTDTLLKYYYQLILPPILFLESIANTFTNTFTDTSSNIQYII